MRVFRVAARVWASRVAAATLIVVLGGAAPRAFAAEPVPMAKLSLNQRLATAPDSTVVRIRPRLTTTLGKLRAAHRAREAALVNARAAGIMARRRLYAKPMATVSHVGTFHYGAGPAPTPVTYRQHIGGVPFSKPPVYAQKSNGGPPSLSTPPVYLQKSNGGPPSLPTPTPAPTPFTIVEPASQYASAPSDMRAFCDAAQASACAYLPAQQSGSFVDGSLGNIDWLLPQSQCGPEGGSWTGGYGAYYCIFSYPFRIVVYFTPAKSYRLQQSATCDTSLWNYTVDPHGVILIYYNKQLSAHWSTTNNPTCVVRVAVGP